MAAARPRRCQVQTDDRRHELKGGQLTSTQILGISIAAKDAKELGKTKCAAKRKEINFYRENNPVYLSSNPKPTF